MIGMLFASLFLCRVTAYLRDGFREADLLTHVSAISPAGGVNRELYQQFGKLNLPRHTSYPSVPFWSNSVDRGVFSRKIGDLAQALAPTAFYLHVPFCERLCHYCACNKLVISHKNAEAARYAQRYIDGLEKELDWVNAQRHGVDWNVHQIHWGGGTPTWLGVEEIERVWSLLTRHMKIHAEAEISIELDPRVTSYEQLTLLRRLGFNRVSLGVQDFDPDVQNAIQRVQPEAMVDDFVRKCREVGFQSVNFDLIYGLPMQTRESMDRTLARVVEMSPDRIAFYRLALLPNAYKWQRTFKEKDIPGDELVLDFMLRAIQVFGENGWDFIGLDHFAKKTDELSKAYQAGTLRRSFQGMTTGDALPVIGVGPSAISCLGDLFAQNETQFPAWAGLVNTNGCATVKGHQLSADDRLRQSVLNQIYCYRFIDKEQFQREFDVNFDDYFTRSKEAWDELEKIGFIENSKSVLRVLRVLPTTGWLLLRVFAATIDGYLDKDAWKTGVHSGVASRVG
jgi:oxygen-independent coproporphyrinogen III oxidase